MPNRRIFVRGWQYLKAAGRPGPDLSWITDRLAVSGTVRPSDYDWLAQRHVEALLDLREEDRGDPELLGQRGIDFLHIPVKDHFPPSQEQLDEGSQWVLQQLEAGRRTVVHCKEGIGRSIALACCVLMRTGYPLWDALALLARKRWGVALNAVQMQALYEYDRRMNDGTSPR